MNLAEAGRRPAREVAVGLSSNKHQQKTKGGLP
jgi:hypothetical protein